MKNEVLKVKIEMCLNDIEALMTDEAIEYGSDSHWKLCDMIDCIDAICRDNGYKRKWTRNGYRIIDRD